MNVIIVGGGKVGTHLACLLLEAAHHVKVIEIRPEKLHTLRRDLPAEVVVQGSGTQPATLESAGIRQANVLAAVTGADETNIVAASLARFEFGVQRVIARVNNPRNAWLFTPEMGIDVGLNQADLMAHLITEEMALGDLVTLLALDKGKYTLVEEKVAEGTSTIGKAVTDLPLPAECAVTAVLRRGTLLVPRGDIRLEAGDEVLAIVKTSQVNRLGALLR